jgi:hypothetical protein
MMFEQSISSSSLGVSSTDTNCSEKLLRACPPDLIIPWFSRYNTDLLTLDAITLALPELLKPEVALKQLEQQWRSVPEQKKLHALQRRYAQPRARIHMLLCYR